MKQSPRAPRGVSLIEALVALAVMGFGMLGVVGMQVSMRSNADAAKQRAEAVRIAQATMEDQRQFQRLSTGGIPDAAARAFEEIVDFEAAPFTGYSSNPDYSSNTTYYVSGTASTVSAGGPKLKTVKVTVSWRDRSDQPQSVVLMSAIAGIAPDLAGSLAIPGDRNAPQTPGGRSTSIPTDAVNQGDGSSILQVARNDGVSWTWRFDNATGLITQVCQPTCVTVSDLYLSGYISFATKSQPTPALAETPDGTPDGSIGRDFSLQVITSSPSKATVSCLLGSRMGNALAYYCAIPGLSAYAQPGTVPSWTGFLHFAGHDLTVASSVIDATASSQRVCRYTTQLTDADVPSNVNHPYRYVNVTSGLSNQNYLVIKAGDGSIPYACPADDVSTPSINGNTYRHEPQ
jgi:Tfp pilus assembly protein PilV